MRSRPSVYFSFHFHRDESLAAYSAQSQVFEQIASALNVDLDLIFDRNIDIGAHAGLISFEKKRRRVSALYVHACNTQGEMNNKECRRAAVAPRA